VPTRLAGLRYEPAALVLAASFAGLAVLIGLLAVRSPAAALAGTFGLAFLAVTLKDLTAGLCLFTVLSFFEQVPGFEDSSFSMPKIAGAILVVSWLLVIADRTRPAPILFRDRALLAYAAVALLGWTWVTRLWADDVSVAGANGFRLMLGVVLVFIVFTAVREPKHLRWIIWSYIAGAFLSALVGLAETGPEGGAASLEEGRLAGGIADPNELAAMLVPALMLSAFGLAAVKTAVARCALGIGIVVFAVALLLTESRGGLVALITVLVVAVAMAGPLRPRVVAVALVVCALGVSYYTLVAPPESLQRLTEFAASGGTGRTDLWSIAVEVIGDHPVVGVGMGNFQVVEPAYAAGTLNLPSVEFVVDTPKVVHNTYLEVWAELGVVGFAFFTLLILRFLALGWAGMRAFARGGDREHEALARGFLVGLVGMLAAFMFISGQYEKQFWLLLGLAAALPTAAGAAARESQ
jgi:O-antigen ligase